MDSSTKKNIYLTHDSKLIYVVSLLIGFSIFWGVASFKHIGPGFFDNYINLQVSVVLSLAFTIFFCFNKNLKYLDISLLNIGWLYFFILVALQPAINPILYSDSLVFVLGVFALALILSLIVVNLSNQLLLLRISTMAIFIAALFTTFTLIAQTLELSFLYNWIVMPIENDSRPIGNVAQPNQAAFILVLGVLALFYFEETTRWGHHKVIFIAFFLLYSVALALTSSRGGVILFVLAIFSYILLKGNSKRGMLTRILMLLGLFIIGYIIGSAFLELFREEAQTGIERFSSSLIKLRYSQLIQAILIFADNWFTGAGWGNFSAAGLDYTDKIEWVHFASHSHLIFSHIMAELGILGLIGTLFFVYVLVKRLITYRQNVDNKEFRLAMSVCLCVVAYSFSEFPLWYLKYLIIFVIYAGYLDYPVQNVNVSLNKNVVLIAPIILLIGSIYYLIEFTKYAEVNDYLTYSNVSNQKKFELYKELSTPYGFSFYNEVILFNFLPLNSQDINLKLSVGNRVVHQSPIPPFAIKQAIFLGLNKQEADSLKLFQAACLFNYSQDCELVTTRLNSLGSQLPNYFANINVKFNEWKQSVNIL